MGRVAGVFDNPPGFPCTPPGVDILEGGKLTSNNVAGSSHDPLQGPAVASGAVSKPGGDTAGQDALHSAGVEGPEDSGARSKLPQPFSQGTHLLSVGRLIVVGDQAYHRCVISKFDDDIGAVCSCTVVCVQGVQEWAEDAALRCTSVEDQGR